MKSRGCDPGRLVLVECQGGHHVGRSQAVRHVVRNPESYGALRIFSADAEFVV